VTCAPSPGRVTVRSSGGVSLRDDVDPQPCCRVEKSDPSKTSHSGGGGGGGGEGIPRVMSSPAFLGDDVRRVEVLHRGLIVTHGHTALPIIVGFMRTKA
jgi:hypothetical protein